MASRTWRQEALWVRRLTSTLTFSQWMQTDVRWWNRFPMATALLPSPARALSEWQPLKTRRQKSLLRQPPQFSLPAHREG